MRGRAHPSIVGNRAILSNDKRGFREPFVRRASSPPGPSPICRRWKCMDEVVLERVDALRALEGVAAHRVAILAAPEGFGKSTLVRALDRDAYTVLDIASDRTFERFVSNMARSAAPLARGLNRSVTRVYARALEREDGPAVLAAWFARSLAGVTRTLVVDGADAAPDPRIAAFLRAAIASTPATVRWLLVGRDPERLQAFASDDHGRRVRRRGAAAARVPRTQTLGDVARAASYERRTLRHRAQSGGQHLARRLPAPLLALQHSDGRRRLGVGRSAARSLLRESLGTRATRNDGRHPLGRRRQRRERRARARRLVRLFALAHDGPVSFRTGRTQTPSVFSLAAPRRNSNAHRAERDGSLRSRRGRARGERRHGVGRRAVLRGRCRRPADRGRRTARRPRPRGRADARVARGDRDHARRRARTASARRRLARSRRGESRPARGREGAFRTRAAALHAGRPPSRASVIGTRASA